jgi:hypothetical protein
LAQHLNHIAWRRRGEPDHEERPDTMADWYLLAPGEDARTLAAGFVDETTSAGRGQTIFVDGRETL